MIDLHMHSKYSADGTYSLKEILKRAETNNLRYISITDHDDVNVYNEIEKTNIKNYYSGQIIKGIELKILYNGVSMELLGYNIDTKAIAKSKWLDKNIKREIQHKEFQVLKSVCKQLNLRLDPKLSLGTNKFGGATIYECLLKYKENKQTIEDLNITSDSNFYRNHICNKNSSFYVNKEGTLPTLKEGSELIRSMGGLVFLAHPLNVYCLDNEKEVLEEIINTGLVDGLECIHSFINKEKSDYLIKLCDKYNLYKSGGSDFHDDSIVIGTSNYGKDRISFDLSKDWIQKVDKL